MSQFLPNHTLFAAAVLSWFLPAYADGFDMMSRHEELQNHVIVDTGDFEKIRPAPGRFSTTEVLKLKSTCFETVGSAGLWGIGKKAGLVLVNKEKSIRVALLEPGIGSIIVKVTTVLQIECPTADSDGLPIDPQLRLQELRRRQEALRKELERPR